jgi:hypothetical protein
MSDYPADIHTEQEDIDPDTLANLGPLRPLAGTWRGEKGLDVNPNVDGSGRQGFIETIDCQPIDPQSNGPQLLYGLRYHVQAIKPGEVQAYHDQIGYWLWEPATGLILHSLTIPRGQAVLAAGKAAPDARDFEVSARRGETEYGIVSTAFLEYAFRTEAFRMQVTIHSDDSWSYFEETTLLVRGQDKPFAHTDRNTLTRVAPPRPNGLMLA